MSAIETHFVENLDTMHVTLDERFVHENWPEFQSFYNAQTETRPVRVWDIDLRRVSFINSMMLGCLVAFNAVVQSRGGEMRLVLAKGSKPAEIIYLSKLQRIINVREA